jgi:hypothetical protein
MRESLHEMEVAQARADAIQTHKRKLNARKSLGKGGSILAPMLQKTKDKRRQEADDKLKRARNRENSAMQSSANFTASSNEEDQFEQVSMAPRPKDLGLITNALNTQLALCNEPPLRDSLILTLAHMFMWEIIVIALSRLSLTTKSS